MTKKNKQIQTTKKRELKPSDLAELRKATEPLSNIPLNNYESVLKSFLDKSRNNEDTPKDLSKLLNTGNLNNFRGITEAVDEVAKGRATEFAIKLYQEYNCQTASEKALAQIATVSFERILDLSRRLHIALNYTTQPEIINSKAYHLILKRTQMVALELDRANRHYLTAIQTLKQVKTPQAKINVKTNTAFVAQNQQFNAERKEDKSDENIEAK